MYALETKYHSPIARNADRPIAGTIAFQRVQPETRQIHVGWSRRLVKTGQDAFDLGDLFRRESSPLSFLVQGQDPLMLEVKDHNATTTPTINSQSFITTAFLLLMFLHVAILTPTVQIALIRSCLTLCPCPSNRSAF